MPWTRNPTCSSRGHLGGGRLEHPDELPADDLALLLRVGDVGQRGQEPVGGVHGVQIDPGGRHEVPLDLLPLPGPQQPVIDEHAGQTVADGPLHERGGHRGVHPAGQPADRPAVADLGPHRVDRVVDDRRRGPAVRDPGDLLQEPAQHLLPVRRVPDLGVVLHAGQPPLGVLERGDRGPLATTR